MFDLARRREAVQPCVPWLPRRPVNSEGQDREQPRYQVSEQLQRKPRLPCSQCHAEWNREYLNLALKHCFKLYAIYIKSERTLIQIAFLGHYY